MKNSVHPDPDGIRFMSSSNWHSPSMADNGTELNFLGTMEPHVSHISSYISPVSHDNFKAGHGQNSGISPFSFWLLWTLWSGTGVELVTISGTWLAWWFGTWLGTWLLYDFPTFIYFHIWDVILPIDEVICFKMVKTTNQQQMVTLWWLHSSRTGKSPRLRTVNPCKSSISIAIFLC